MQKCLSERKNQGRRLDKKEVLSYFSQLVLAVKYLHDSHILHRDIKVQNIFLTKEGLIKLGDFGIAKQLEFTDDLAQTSLGTPFYVSPEICQGTQYSYKSDIWMMGCVLYELSQLQKPFNGTSIHVPFLSHLRTWCTKSSTWSLTSTRTTLPPPWCC